MKKYSQIILCLITVFTIISLTGCKEKTVNSGEQKEISSQNESSQTDSTVSDSSDTAQIKNPDEDYKVDTDNSDTTSAPQRVHTHNYSNKKVAATCTTEGYTLKSCECGHSEKTAVVSALGHSWDNWATVKNATTTSTGLQRRVCTRCGETSEKVLEKLPQPSSDLKTEILRLVNEERAKHGLNALQYYSVGQAAADVRATEINTLFDHTRPNGTSCFTALDEIGVKYRGAGENIAKGYTTAEAVMEGWMNSDGHRKNILNANFTHIIVGVNNKCWVQLFLTI